MLNVGRWCAQVKEIERYEHVGGGKEDAAKTGTQLGPGPEFIKEPHT